MKNLYKVIIANEMVLEALGDEALQLRAGEKVVIRCERYLDYGQICPGGSTPVEDEEELNRQRASQGKKRRVEGDSIPIIERRLTPEDQATIQANQIQADEAQVKAFGRIRDHQLEMKLLSAHFSLDRKLLMFEFSADGRVDFRELLRDLTTLFRSRVELRQVGVRDEAAVLGGVGCCGQTFCCARFLKTFNTINVRMAKQQGLALNPQNISGCCGRLKCCLAFEADYYRENPVYQQKRMRQDGEEELDEAALEALNDSSTSEEQEAASSRSQGGNRYPQRNQERNGGQGGRFNRNGQNGGQNHQNRGNRPRRPNFPNGGNRNNNNRPRQNGGNGEGA